MTSFWLQRCRSQKYIFLWVYINTSSDFSFGFVLMKWWCNIKIEKDCKCLKNVSLWINPFLAKFPFYTPYRSSRPEIHRKTPVPESLSLQTLTQVFSCEFCEISNTTFSYRTPPVAVSVHKNIRTPKVIY